MVVNLEPMEAPAKGYRLTSPQTESVFSVWEVEGKIYDAPLGVHCPVEKMGRGLEVKSLMEGVEWVREQYEGFFRAEVLFLLSIHLPNLGYQFSSTTVEEELVQRGFFERFSLVDFHKSSLSEWVIPFLEEEVRCIVKRN